MGSPAAQPEQVILVLVQDETDPLSPSAQLEAHLPSLLRHLREHGLQPRLLTTEAPVLGKQYNHSTKDAKTFFLAVSLTAENLEVEAERMKISKPLLKPTLSESLLRVIGGSFGLFQPFSVSTRRLFITQFRSAAATKTLFTPAERFLCIHAALDAVGVGKLSAWLDNKDTQHSITERLSLVDSLTQTGLLAAMVRLHDVKGARQVYHACMAKVWTDPIKEIRAYYGDELALYFAWIQYFTHWLVPLGAVGFAVWFWRPPDETVDDSTWLPFYGLFVIFWSHLFFKCWKRKAADLSCRWGTLPRLQNLGITGGRQDLDLNNNFVGDQIRQSPITGKPTKYYTSWKRIPRYLLSGLVTFMALGVAVVCMIISLNLQGYMSNPSSPFHFASIHQFSAPGAIFDPNGPIYLALVPVVLHSMTIMTLNGWYRHVAEWLTEVENHRYLHEQRNSLILKRFLFEAFDCYLPLFYLAFYELDAQLLRGELVALYTTDSVRRVTTESLLPFLLISLPIWCKRYCSREATETTKEGKRKEENAHKKDEIRVRKRARRSLRSKTKDKIENNESDKTLGIALDKDTVNSILMELRKDEYESFDDWLEMVIEFGYITLFASAFPLASILSIVCNLIEIRSDAFKLCFATRRPRPQFSSGLGTWTHVMQVMVWCAVFTNCMIFVFSTEQLERWIPQWFEDAPTAVGPDVGGSLSLEAGQTVQGATELFKAGYGRFAVGFAFGLEHVLVLICLAIHFLIPDEPLWVSMEVKRRLHLELESMRYGSKKRKIT